MKARYLDGAQELYRNTPRFFLVTQSVDYEHSGSPVVKEDNKGLGSGQYFNVFEWSLLGRGDKSNALT